MKKLLWVGVVSAFALSLVAVAGVVAADNIDDLGGNIFDTVSVDLKVNGQDGPVTVQAGSRIVVSWISEGAARCRGNWSRNDIKTSGTVAGRISKSVTIKAACIDREGNRDDDSVVVNVEGKPQIVQQPTTGTSASNVDKTQIQRSFDRNASVLLEVLSKEIADFRRTIKGEAVLVSYDKETDALIRDIKRELTEIQVDLQGALANATEDVEINQIDAKLGAKIEDLGKDARKVFNDIKQRFSATTPTTSAQKKINIEPQITADGFSYTGQVGVEFSKMFIADAAVEWDILNIETKLPPGLSLVKFGAFAGQIKGVPTKSGTYVFDLIARESASNGVGTVTVRINITAPTPTTTTSPITVDLKVLTNNSIPSDGPITVNAGTAIALSYTTTGKIEKCTGDISGDSSASIRAVANVTKTYAVSCTQDGGTGTASDTVTVSVTQEAPTIVVPPDLSATAPTISGTRTAAGDKLYPGQMSITATISNSGGQLTTPISARFQYSPNTGANWYDFQEVGPVSTTPRNVTHSWEGGSGSFCFRLAIGTGTDNVSSSSCIEIIPKEGAFIGLSRELAAVAVPDSDVWAFIKAWLGR